MPLIVMAVDVEQMFKARVLQNPSPDCRQPGVSARRNGNRIIIDSNGIPDHQNVGEVRFNFCIENVFKLFAHNDLCTTYIGNKL